MTGAYVFIGVVCLIGMCVLAWAVGDWLRRRSPVSVQRDAAAAEREAAEHAAPHEPHVDQLLPADPEQLHRTFPRNEHGPVERRHAAS